MKFYPEIPSRYFNPRSPRGERLHGHLCAGHLIYISIHAPRGGSDCGQNSRRCLPKYFNPRSPRGERRGPLYIYLRSLCISIHAPRGGSDSFQWSQTRRFGTFQSTLPAGGATFLQTACKRQREDFNPRSPRGERRQRLPKACEKLVQVPVNVKGTVR